jgi:hypothetical protein
MITQRGTEKGFGEHVIRKGGSEMYVSNQEVMKGGGETF